MKRNRRKVAAGIATTTIAEPLLMFSHQGGVGVIIGLGLGMAAYLGADEIADWRECHGFGSGERAETAPVLRAVAQGKSNGAGFCKRLLVGRSVREVEIRTDDEPDTVFVDEEEPATQDLLELGWNLHPHVNWFFSKRVSILGMSGSGKSNLLARIVECLGKYDAPLILLDSKPEYHKLCSKRFLVNAFYASRQNLLPQQARAFARTMMDKRLHVVVDLTSYEPEEAAQVMIDLALGVANYQNAILATGGILIPCTFIVDEAHKWFPEDESQSLIHGVKLAGDQSPLLARLQRTYFKLETEGRSFGMGLITATQRPANVDKRLISEAEWRFMLKAMEPSDLKRYRTYGATDEQIISLNPNKGEAYVVGPDGSRGIYRIHRRESPDEAKSPGVENLRRAAASGSVPRVPAFPGQGHVERGNACVGTENVPAGTPRKQPAEPLPPVPGEWERSPVAGNDGNAPAPMREAEVGYTLYEERAVLRAYHDVLAANGGVEPSRRAIQQQMQQGGRYYQRVIRPVLDKHTLSMQKDAEEKYGSK